MINNYIGKYNDAIDEFQKCYQIAVSKNGKQGQRSATEELSLLYEKIGDYKNAYKYYVKFKTLSDSITNDENLAAIAIKDVEYQFEIEKAQKEQQLEKAQSSIRNRTFFIIAALLILALVTAIAFILRRNNQQKNKQNEILEEKVQKRTTELLASNRELEEIKQKQVLEEAKSRFFANVSHEFRTPLTLIQAPIQRVLQDKSLTTNNVSMLQKALRNSKNLMHLVTDILDLGKLETEKVGLNETSQVLYLVVRRVIANFETYAQSKNIALKLEYHPNTDLQVELDKGKFERILYNYISNALKFTSKGGNVTVLVHDLQNQLQVVVADNGKGIPTNELETVFERYYQVKSPNEYAPLGQINHYAGGTGIGLALCKEYAALFKGKVWAESPNDRNGTTFYFEFPKKEFFAPLATQDVITINQSENDSITPMAAIPNTKKIAFNASQQTILIVEDNYDLRQFLKELLEGDYNILTAENGQDALQKLEKQSCQLIISDVMMPIMDGFELLEHLKSNDKYRHIPTMMLTARAEMKDKLKALRIGVDDYMLKPFHEEELAVRVNNLLLNVNSRLEELSHIAAETDENPTIEISNQDNEWLIALEEIINQHIGDFSYKADDIADELRVSRSYLFQTTKKLTGLTLNQYIKEARLQQARELLENQKLDSVKAVAYSVGFKHTNYFSQSFEQRFGKRPSAYF